MKLIGINSQIKTFFNNAFGDFNKKERILFPVIILVITALSFYTDDSKIALVCAICGISYTIFNGKGNIFCFLFGIAGTVLYSYLAYKNGLWGNFVLNLFYYLPLEILGIYNWKKHLINKVTVRKTTLKKTGKYICLGAFGVITVTLATVTIIFRYSFLNFLDFLSLFLSVIAMILAVKRCREQWYCWSVVNFIMIMVWIIAYINGSNCLATILMWVIYFIAGIYFLKQWKNAAGEDYSTIC